MKKIKIQILLLIMLSVLLVFTTISMANQITYYLGGRVENVVTENAVLKYNLNGSIEEIRVGDVVITCELNGGLASITTPSGVINFNFGTDIDSIDGNWNDICNDVEEALKTANSEITNYITSIQIQVPGASNPSESVTVITNSFNKIIEQLNSYDTYSTSSNSESTSLNSNKVENDYINSNITTNDVKVNTNNKNIEVNSNGVNINSNNASLSVSEDGINFSIPEVGQMNIGGTDVTNNSSNSINNNMVLYIIIGVVCYVVILIIIFIIKAINGNNANMKLVKVSIAVATLFLVAYIGLVAVLNIFKKPTNMEPVGISSNNASSSPNNNLGTVGINSGNVSPVTENSGLNFLISGNFKENSNYGNEVAGNIIKCMYNGETIWDLDEFVLKKDSKDSPIIGYTFSTVSYQYAKTDKFEVLFDSELSILAFKSDDAIFCVNPNDTTELLLFKGSISAMTQSLDEAFDGEELRELNFSVGEDMLKQIEKFKE